MRLLYVNILRLETFHYNNLCPYYTDIDYVLCVKIQVTQFSYHKTTKTVRNSSLLFSLAFGEIIRVSSFGKECRLTSEEGWLPQGKMEQLHIRLFVAAHNRSFHW